MNRASDPQFARLLCDSYQRLTEESLTGDVVSGDDMALARWLYAENSACLLAHDGQADPIFTYANKASQALFGYDWDEFVTLPSRLSAEAPERAERQRLLDAVARDGFISDYRGVRIAKDGRCFWIERATVWQLIDAAGHCHGQAAVFSNWRDV